MNWYELVHHVTVENKSSGVFTPEKIKIQTRLHLASFILGVRYSGYSACRTGTETTTAALAFAQVDGVVYTIINVNSIVAALYLTSSARHTGISIDDVVELRYFLFLFLCQVTFPP